MTWVNEKQTELVQAKDDNIRCFVGISADDMGLEDALMAQILQWQRRTDMQDLRWTPRSFLHLTLTFMGAQSRQTLTPLALLLDDALKGIKAFPVSVTHCSGFPDAQSRILAAIPQSTPSLLALQQVVAHAVSSLGINLETRPYLPHITLGRLGRHQCLPDFVEPLIANGLVRAVSLYRSDAIASGSHYTVMARWPLNA